MPGQSATTVRQVQPYQHTTENLQTQFIPNSV